jgi:S1-C subfamily serine protease
MNGSARFFNPITAEMSAVVSKVRESVVLIRSRGGQGSGVVWSGDGVIVTNDHVVAGNRASIVLPGGRNAEARVVARDGSNDLALLQSPQIGLAPALIGDSRLLRVGEFVIAIGHPHGVVGTATLGIITAAPGAARFGRARNEKLLADMELAPGSSGGPWVNSAGEVVAVSSMIVSPGMAVGVPSHIIAELMERAAKGAAVRAA